MYGATSGASDFWRLCGTYQELGGLEDDEGSAELLRAFFFSLSLTSNSHSRIWCHGNVSVL